MEHPIMQHPYCFYLTDGTCEVEVTISCREVYPLDLLCQYGELNLNTVCRIMASFKGSSHLARMGECYSCDYIFSLLRLVVEPLSKLIS